MGKMNAKFTFLLVILFAELSAEGKPTALHLAAWLGSAEQCRFLLENGATIDELDQFKKTALMVAAIYGRVKAVKAILEFHPNTEIKDRYHNTALSLATPECARVIRKHQTAERNKNN